MKKVKKSKIAKIKKAKIKPRIVRMADGIYVVEFAPQRRTIKTTEWSFGNQIGARTFDLSFPYMQFGRLDEEDTGCCVTFSQKPLERNDDPVYMPLLPNIGSDGSVCMGGYYDIELEPGEIIEKSKWKRKKTFLDRIDYFWNSSFASGLGWAGEQKLGCTKIKTFQGWENRTKKDPSFILRASLGKSQAFNYLTGINWNDWESHDPGFAY